MKKIFILTISIKKFCIFVLSNNKTMKNALRLLFGLLLIFLSFVGVLLLDLEFSLLWTFLLIVFTGILFFTGAHLVSKAERIHKAEKNNEYED